MQEKTIDGFMQLFHGRTDVYGHDEGRCIKEPLTRDIWLGHLLGETPIGVYPIMDFSDGNYTAWGCSDIDINDYSLAVALSDALYAAGVVSYIEVSRSKGYHVWVFAEELVLASDMRKMFLAAHQVAGIIAKEVNPKQSTLEVGKVGNYVRLPYPHGATTRRIVIDADRLCMTVDSFVEQALETRTSLDLIAHIATYYQPPKSNAYVGEYAVCESVQEALKSVSPLGKVIWRDGPLAGRDRSSTLAKLGHECVRSGMNPSETGVLLQDADKRWGKYHLRADGYIEIDKLIQRVFL